MIPDMNDDPAPAPPLLILCRDLLLGSKITATAQSAGIVFTVVRDAAKLHDQPGARLIVDNVFDGAIEAAAAWKAEHGGAVVGFVSHVDTETIRRAREAGLDRVLARSAFVIELETIIA